MSLFSKTVLALALLGGTAAMAAESPYQMRTPISGGKQYILPGDGTGGGTGGEGGTPTEPTEPSDATLADLVLSATSHNFGNLAYAATEKATFTLTNTAQKAIALASPISATAFPFTFASTTCTAELAPSASCNLEYSYLASSAGSYSKDVQVKTATLGNKTISLQGEHVPPDVLSITGPSPLDWGEIATGVGWYQSWTITNIGGTASGKIKVTGAHAWMTLSGTCPDLASLASGQTCTLNMELTPEYEGNEGSANLKIVDNTRPTSPVYILVTFKSI